MAISKEEVLHVAGLAHLELTEEEVERFTDQLGAILEAVGKVAELDLTGVEPLSHPLDLVNVWAEDEPRPSWPIDEALGNAPESEDNHFRVPPTGMTRES
jgi:aspartyl-tRNA(Asn)/glutamyl-tRNA(Gln) amidotransferase subunit C